MSNSVANHINDYYNNTSRDAAWGNFTSSSPDSLSNILMNATFTIFTENIVAQENLANNLENEIKMSENDFIFFESVIANPPEANAALKKLMSEK